MANRSGHCGIGGRRPVVARRGARALRITHSQFTQSGRLVELGSTPYLGPGFRCIMALRPERRTSPSGP